MEQRSLLVFQESCRSEATRKAYVYYLNKFKNFYHLKDYDSMISMEPQKLQIMIEDYTMHLKKKVSPNTLPTMIFGIKAFFDANDVDLKWKKIQRLFPEKIKRTGEKAYNKDQIKLMLELAKDLRAKALVLFLATSGVRIGAIPDLKLKHVADFEDCKAVTVYAGTAYEYTTFLTPEASKALNSYFEKRIQDGEFFTKNTPLFRTTYKLRFQKVKKADKATLQEIVRRLMIKAGLRTGKQGHRYDIQIDNGFRKFFNEAIKSTEGINLNYAEKLLGHSVTIPLDNHYLNPLKNKILAEYKKAIPNLTIDEAEKEKAEKEKLKVENAILQEKTERIEYLTTEIDKVKNWIEMQTHLQDPKDEQIRKLQAELDRLKKV